MGSTTLYSIPGLFEDKTKKPGIIKMKRHSGSSMSKSSIYLEQAGAAVAGTAAVMGYALSNANYFLSKYHDLFWFCFGFVGCCAALTGIYINIINFKQKQADRAEERRRADQLHALALKAYESKDLK